jgi:uncharacterized protein (UPF0261 family)
MVALGHMFAEKANLAVGPTVICVPLRGFSVPDSEGGLFWDPEADTAFVEALQQDLEAHVQLERVDAHVNSAEFVKVAVERLLTLLDGSRMSAPIAARSGIERSV